MYLHFFVNISQTIKQVVLLLIHQLNAILMKIKLLIIFFLGVLNSPSIAQNVIIKGKVFNQENKSMAGVSVKIKGSELGTATDSMGKYQIQAPATGTLVFSFVSYATREIAILNKSEIDVTMYPIEGELDAVVVIGYGTQKKKDLTGSISSVSVDDYKNQPVLNVASALQGKVAGLEISNPSGAPGKEAKVHIRGANSINSSNNPLYVVDGIALSSLGLSDININDIISMEVLKDASATAVYGSRGANGVILITTKRGEIGNIKIDYNGFFSSNHPMKTYKLRNAEVFATEANYIAGSNVFPNPSSFAGNSTNWQDMIFQNGITQSHQLSLSGGTEKSRYYISGYYANQSGLLINTNQQKFSLNSTLESKINKNATFSLGLLAGRKNATNNDDIGGKGNPVTGSLAWAPTEKVYDSLTFYNRNAVSPIWANPYMILKERNNKSFSNYALLSSKLSYKLTPYLKIDVLFGLNLNILKSAYLNNDWIAPGNPGAGQSQNESYSFQNSNILTFQKTFNNEHDLTIMALEETSTNKTEGFNAFGSGLSSTSNGFYNLGLNASQSISSHYSNWALLSYVGRVSYSYRNRYLFTGTVRADGSSKFQKTANKWGYFPSVALGWNVSDEGFVKDLDLFSHLKLRASYGITGSQGIDPYSSLGLLTPVQYSFGTATLFQGYMQGNPNNPDLKWETTGQAGLGIEMGFWNNRLNITLDYYDKITRDLLLNTPIPGYNGGGVSLQNIGKVKNKGFETTVNAVPFESENFRWSTTVNASVNRNKVLSLGKDSMLFRSDFLGQGFINTSIQVVKVGESLGTFFLIPWEGVYSDKDPVLGYQPGDNHYRDVNNDGEIDFSDRVISGSAMPKAFFGWNNSLRYKNIEMNLFFQASIGNKIFNATYAIIAAPNSDVYYPTLAESVSYWTPDRKNADWADPSSKTGRNFTESTQYLQDGSYYKLKNISLSYYMPKKIFKMDASLSLSAQNVFTITNYKGFDPEASSTPSNSDASAGIDFGAYPSPKTISFGLHIGF